VIVTPLSQVSFFSAAEALAGSIAAPAATTSAVASTARENWEARRAFIVV
jgi:hypothetical protein